MKRAALGAAVVALLCSTARADTISLMSSKSSSDLELDPTYLVDGGALPFFWGALAGTLVLDHTLSPRHSPLLFPSSEGGLSKSSWEVPSWAVGGLGAGLAIGMFASGDASRMYHIKGLAESLMTSGLAAGVLKQVVGRHRPDWSSTNDGTDEHRSFPSGHSTEAFAIATYGILFLHDHVFDKTDSRLAAGLTYAGIGLGAAAIAGERVYHHRHHLTDVAAGAALGTLSSTLFYLYQEHRFRDHQRKEGHSLQVTPSFSDGAAMIGISGTW